MAKSVKVSKTSKALRALKTKEETAISPKQLKHGSSLFPKIYRFITESWKLIVASFVSGLIIIAIILQGMQLYKNIQEQQAIKAKRGAVEKELSFWRNQLTRYKDSRDIYFRIAALEYTLGDKEGAKEDLQRALEIDPNFKEGREMEKLLEK